MKFNKSMSLLITLTLLPSVQLSAHAAAYVAPLCIGASFAGAFSWSVFRKSDRTPITHETVNPVVLIPQKKDPTVTYSPLATAIEEHKKHHKLNHVIPLSPTEDLKVSRTIPRTTTNPLWIVAPGYKGRRPQKYQQGAISLDSSLHEASTLLCASHIPATCVTFEFDDSRRSFNFAQKGDLARLSLIYNELAPTHTLVLFGSCRGGTTVLNLLSRPDTLYKDSIKALILESPALSLKKLAQQVGSTYLNWLPGSPTLIHTFFKGWFPSYDSNYPSCLSGLGNIPHELPILIGHVEHDKVIAWSDIQDLVSGLIKTGHTQVYLARITDPSISHARLNSNEQFRQVLNAFLAHYNLPHDNKMARAGADLLETARQEAQRVAQQTP